MGISRGHKIRIALLAAALACLVGTIPAHAQISLGGDIHWESEWTALAPLAGWDPDTYDDDEDGILVSWDFALAEAVITTPGLAGHTDAMVDMFNANLAALTSENPAMAAAYGHLAALQICRYGADSISPLSEMSDLGWTPTPLTEGLYSENSLLRDNSDLDSDLIRNDQEQGATDAASYIEACTTSNLQTEGDIPWEAEWAVLAGYFSQDPDTWSVSGDEIPDAWVLALAEAVITNPAIVQHSPAMRTMYNANLVALIGENPGYAQVYGYIAALVITMGGFDDANDVAMLAGQGYTVQPLTEGLYQSNPVLHGNYDLDGDLIPNKDEQGATDAASYIEVCTTSNLALEGDIPWEEQWEALATDAGLDPDTADVDGGGVPDRWEFSLAEAIITNPAIVQHSSTQRALFNANLAALADDHIGFAIDVGYLAALLISMGEFDTADTIAQLPFLSYSSQPLTESLYDSDPALAPDIDLDGDGPTNHEETGATDAASYVAVCTTSSIPYSLGLRQALLPPEYYAGGKVAANGMLNNAGTVVAFFGSVFPGDSTMDLYLVDVDDPSSWRVLAADLSSAFLSPISWSPDDSTIYHRNKKIDVATGAVESFITRFGYSLRDPVMTARSENNWMLINRDVSYVLPDTYTDCAYSAEFESTGNLEGFSSTGTGDTVADGLYQFSVDTPQPIFGIESISIPSPVNPYVVIRMEIPDSGECNLVFKDEFDQYVFHPFDVATPGMQTYALPMGGVAGWPAVVTALIFQLPGGEALDPVKIDFVRLCEGPAAPAPGMTRNLIALPVLPDGSEDSGREPVVLTRFAAGELDGMVDRPAISSNGNEIVFVDFSENPNLSEPEGGEIYVLHNVHAILDAPFLSGGLFSTEAPASLADPDITAVRVDGVPDNFVHTPAFSEDGTLVFFTEDWNNVWNGENPGSLFGTNFDLMVSRSNGTGGVHRVNATHNQAMLTTSRGGTRLVYTDWATGTFNFRLYITTMSGHNAITGDPLPGNDVLVTAPIEFGDGSGTTMEIPAGTTVDFPPDVPQQITIKTPVVPVSEQQLPAGVSGVVVVREFGPAGTQFSPPAEITITYTDGEVGAQDESEIVPYLFNDATQIFDIPVTTIVSRDTENNSITFTVDHFSTYALVVANDAGVPWGGIPGLLLLVLVLSTLGACVLHRRAE
ncbi:MAG: hypothetical protein HYV27_07915 [Candidatus Hydrogenedentes bacterium]|nr:hypothetical protein [Candidatus Hydrogenedentota bacterium]